MRDLDETDLEIVRLLSEDARRPFSEIADRVGLSPPAVSDRVERLEEQGVIRAFTVDVDRTKLQNRVPVMVDLRPSPDAVERVFETLVELDGTEHVFQLSDGSLRAHATAPDGDVLGWLRDGIDMDAIESYEITHLARYEWSVDVTAADFAIPCAVCDNLVKSDGVTARFGDDIKAFCCPSCEARYEEQYEALTE